MARQRKKLRKPLRIDEILKGRFFHKRGASLVYVYRIQKAWPQIVGEQLAGRTWPKTTRGKTLVISVENPAWAQHLSMMKEQVLRVIEERSGAKFNNLHFVNEAFQKIEFSKDKEESKSQEKTIEKETDLPSLMERVKKLALQLRWEREKNLRNK